MRFPNDYPDHEKNNNDDPDTIRNIQDLNVMI